MIQILLSTILEVADPSTSSTYLIVDTEHSNQHKKTVVMEVDYQLEKLRRKWGMSSYLQFPGTIFVYVLSLSLLGLHTVKARLPFAQQVTFPRSHIMTSENTLLFDHWPPRYAEKYEKRLCEVQDKYLENHEQTWGQFHFHLSTGKNQGQHLQHESCQCVNSESNCLFLVMSAQGRPGHSNHICLISSHGIPWLPRCPAFRLCLHPTGCAGNHKSAWIRWPVRWNLPWSGYEMLLMLLEGDSKSGQM